MMPKKYTKDFLFGKKFNALEYIEHTDTPLKYKTKKSQGMYCKWKCDCGNIIVYLASEVVKGRKKSCECYLYRRKDKHHNWTGCQDISGEYWLGIKNNAKTRKLKFEISIEDAWEIYIKQNKKCVITGIDLTFATSSNSHDGNASLDRILTTQLTRQPELFVTITIPSEFETLGKYNIGKRFHICFSKLVCNILFK